MKASELNAELTALRAQQTKSLGEIRGKIDTLSDQVTSLTDQLANQDLPADAVATLAALKTTSQELDDLVVDAPVDPAAPAEPIDDTPAAEAAANPPVGQVDGTANAARRSMT